MPRRRQVFHPQGNEPMKRFALFAVFCAGAIAAPASAQEDAAPVTPSASIDASTAIGNRFYVSPLGSYAWTDSDRSTDDGWGGALAIGKQFSPYFSAELTGQYTQFDTSGGGSKFKLMGYGVNALLFPFPETVPFYGIVGALYGKGDDHPTIGGGASNYDSVLVDAGIGLLVGPIGFLNDGSIRVEGLYRRDFHNQDDLGNGKGDSFGDAVAHLGLLIPIGTAPPPPTPAPAAVEVVPAVAPADSDGDGVTDDLDQCPGTPAGTPVDATGCPLPASKCKAPEPGHPITLEGCMAGDRIVLRGVNFDFDKSTLTANAKTLLDDLVAALVKAPDVKIEIGGHTDAKGSDEYNQKLSERRAQSVVQYLVGHNVDPGRLTSAGYGESQPVADNETDEGRTLNRRVELKITAGNLPAASAATADSAPAAEAAPAN
jgi:OOP family OmpA-OmpF porin